MPKSRLKLNIDMKDDVAVRGPCLSPHLGCLVSESLFVSSRISKAASNLTSLESLLPEIRAERGRGLRNPQVTVASHRIKLDHDIEFTISNPALRLSSWNFIVRLPCLEADVRNHSCVRLVTIDDSSALTHYAECIMTLRYYM